MSQSGALKLRDVFDGFHFNTQVEEIPGKPPNQRKDSTTFHLGVRSGVAVHRHAQESSPMEGKKQL